MWGGEDTPVIRTDTLEAEAEDWKFKANLGNKVKSYLKTQSLTKVKVNSG